jgi:hypothetical protein
MEQDFYQNEIQKIIKYNKKYKKYGDMIIHFENGKIKYVRDQIIIRDPNTCQINNN